MATATARTRSGSPRPLLVASSGSADPGLSHVVSEFERTTRRAVRVTFDDKALTGDGAELVDVVLSSREAIERELRPRGLVEGGGWVIGRVGLGVLAPLGRPVPAIVTSGDLVQSLLAADEVLVTTHTSGIYIESVFERLGVSAQLAHRIRRVRNGPLLVDALLESSGLALGFLSMNQILRFESRGVVAVSSLPDELQLYRDFIVVPTTSSTAGDVAREFVEFCRGPGSAIFAAHGFAEASDER